MRKNKVIQGTDEWFHNRKGKVTGTYLKAIMGTTKARQEAMYEIIAERLTVGVEEDTSYENAMDRGKRLEPEARIMFEFEKGVKVEEIGLCESDEDSNIANSPDGYIEETNDTEAVEIKCPLGKNYVKMWLTNKVPDEYYWQVVQYFVVNNTLNKLFFVGYNPNIPVHPLHIIEVTRESISNDIEVALSMEREFLVEVDNTLSTIITI